MTELRDPEDLRRHLEEERARLPVLEGKAHAARKRMLAAARELRRADRALRDVRERIRELHAAQRANRR